MSRFIRLIEGTEGAGGAGGAQPPGQSGSQSEQAGQQQGQPSPNGFPVNTPIAEMNSDQQAAYWKFQARKHEDVAKQRSDYDQLKTQLEQIQSASQTEAEKALAEARRDERSKAEQETTARYSALLVGAKFEAALAGKRTPEQITGLLEGLDHTKFLTPTGEVDTDKVSNFAAGLAPAGSSWPDMGGGNRGGSAGASKAEAGRAEAERRWSKKATA